MATQMASRLVILICIDKLKIPHLNFQHRRRRYSIKIHVILKKKVLNTHHAKVRTIENLLSHSLDFDISAMCRVTTVKHYHVGVISINLFPN